jgi:ferredoxin
MKTVIYYFTGTGNTLAVARGLAEKLGETTLIPLRRAIYPGAICPEADAVGIAFPVHFLDMPAIVRQFAENIRFMKNPYIFGIATCGQRPGGALFNLQELLQGNGYTLSAGFAVLMPENYIGPVDLMEDEKVAQEKIEEAYRKVAEIAAAVQERRIAPPAGSGSALLRFGGAVLRTFMRSVYRTPRRFHATSACNRCRLCERICPTRNITVTEDAVRWGRDCIQCYACIHWCPKEAIEIGRRTRGKTRYHHPDVTIKDMLDQRGE